MVGRCEGGGGGGGGGGGVLSGTESIWKTINKTTPDQLSVKKVDLQLEINRKEHRTDEYELDKLIVRRGQHFQILIELDRPYRPDSDSLEIYLMYGPKPRVSKGTLVKLCPNKSDINNSKYWSMKLDAGPEEGFLLVHVMPGVTSMVGEFKIAVDCFTGKQLTRFQVMDPVVVLFNAWCPEDQVYIKDEKEREEYVLNDIGRVYVGSITNVIGRPWIFGQFDDTMLLAALYLLESGDWLSDQNKGDVVEVTRAFTALVNSCDDDNGILCGNWTGDYSGGAPPTSWTGSVDVVETFWKNRPQQVKFGQCWVFSGVLTSLYRALGIPARSVTNFCSGHDHDDSNTIDIHFDHLGNSLSDYDDSTWNFHVWVEAWFTRRDLRNPKYDGWQALDATPQEESSGRMQCGPAPLTAVKAGDTNTGYDVGFVFSEVNGDIVYWIVEDDGDMRIARVDTSGVGKLVATKAVGSSEMVDIKHLYKAEEGSANEREAVGAAARQGARGAYLEDYYKNNTLSEEMKFSVNIGEVKLGESVVIQLEAKNTSSEPKTVKVVMTCSSCTYMGRVLGELKRMQHTLFVPERDTSKCALYLSPEDYVCKMTPDGAVKVSVRAAVDGTNQIYTDSEQFDFKKPSIILTPSSKQVQKGHSIKLKIQVQNPLKVPLKNGRIRLEMARNLRPVNVNCGTVKPKHKMSATVTVQAKKVGERQFVATFNSNELMDIQGECTVNVFE